MMAAMDKMDKKNATTPHFRPGDTVKIHMNVKEGDSERVQVFEGVVLVRRGRGPNESFTVRKISFGVGVERTFPLSSPHIQKIELVRSGRVRRARLYYLRNLTGKSARVDERESSVSDEKVAPTTPVTKKEPAKAESAKAEPRKNNPSPVAQ